jgi:hypothetical protein
MTGSRPWCLTAPQPTSAVARSNTHKMSLTKSKGTYMSNFWTPLFAACLMVGGLTAETVSAQTTQGQIITLREGRAAGRVSIQMQKTSNPCSQMGWYAFEDANSAGRTRIELLLAAYNAGRPVTIVGTGKCDGFGVETVDYIDIQ